MEDINTKIEDSGATADGRLSADEYNDRNEELETAVTRSGQSLTVSETTQLAESLFLNSIKAHSFQDNGVVNAVDLRPVSGASGVKVPTTYANMDGALVSFKPAVNNTGAVTVDIGQTSGIGTQPLVLSTDFSALVGSELDTTLTAQIQYDLGNNRWLLLPWSLAAAAISLPLSVAQGGTGGTSQATAQTGLNVPPNTRQITTTGLLTNTVQTLASNVGINAPESSLIQAQEGTDATTIMSPRRVADAIVAQGGVGGVVGVTVYDTGGADTYDPAVNGATKILIIATGGGGGSGAARTSNIAGETAGTGGAGAGSTALLFYAFSGGVTSLNLFVGNGGAGGQLVVAPGDNGSSGTPTSVTEVGGGAATIIVAGGGAGSTAYNVSIDGNPVVIRSKQGMTGGTVTTLIGSGMEIDGGTGGDAVFGAGGSNSGGGFGGHGGASFWGGGARGETLDEGSTTPLVTANPAEVFGSGGPGSAQGSDGGGVPFQRAGHAGKNGAILIIEYA